MIRVVKTLLEIESGKLYEIKSKCRRRGQVHQKPEQKTFNPTTRKDEKLKA